MSTIKELEPIALDGYEDEFTEEEFEELFGEALAQAKAGQGSDGFVFLQELKEKYLQEAKERGFL